VKAAVCRGIGQIGIEELDEPAPRAGEVKLEMVATGVCRTDLSIFQGHLPSPRPIVLGHEGAGIVETVGDGVHHLLPGDPVAFSFVPSCGTCRYCRAGRANLCEVSDESSFKDRLLDGTFRLTAADGTPLRQFLAVGCFAERCVVPAACAVPIPHALPLWQAALVGCAVVTGVGAVRNAARVRPGESVCVVGCGGVGLQVIAGAKLAGADPIIAIDRVPEKLERARARGATHVVDAGAAEPSPEVRRLTSGGVDHAFEVVGRPETIRLAWDCLRPGATAVVVGLAPHGVDASVPAIDFLSEKSLRGCFYGSGNPAAEIAELALLVAEDRFDVTGAISHTTDLDDVEDAFERLRHGEGARTILVIDPELVGPLPPLA
jgi:S-(hydroxymethyl)glutathione dehydrogenase/alcohol dehydrogenase